jgi:glycerol-3-phosphate dehydrogenase subunit C
LLDGLKAVAGDQLSLVRAHPEISVPDRTMSREGSLEAPVRHPVRWRDPEFHDPAALDAEMRRVFEICHGCRRCFNLCDSFPRLFDLIDNSPSEDVDGVKSEDFSRVTEACTLCDMCFMTKCPYVPPHPWQVDFPHLLLRHRIVSAPDNKTGFAARQLAETDRNGRLARPVAPLANWATASQNRPSRRLMQKFLGIDAHASLPKFASKTFLMQESNAPLSPNAQAPAFGKRKAALFATCIVNYNKPATGMAARAVLNHIGVLTKAAYPGCCGMPFLEQAELEKVAKQAVTISSQLCRLIDDGYEIVTLTASCGLMLKFEWPLIVPADHNVKRLSKSVFDIDEYVLDISKRHGLPTGLMPLPNGVTVHMACHARAQNMGSKAAELLRIIPDTPIDVIERCSGHGGTFGVLKGTHSVAMKVGKPAMRLVANQARGHIVSDCPLAAEHLVQGAREIAQSEGNNLPAKTAEHPIEVFARSYGLL